MARWFISVVIFVGIFSACTQATKPPVRRATSSIRAAAVPPTASPNGEFGQPHRFLLACHTQLMNSWERPADQLELDRQALVATFLCLFGHPRSANASEVAAYVVRNANAGMPVASRLQLIAGLGHLWGIRFRIGPRRVLFLRDVMHPGYQGVDGVVFSIDGELISINFYRFVDTDRRSNEL